MEESSLHLRVLEMETVDHENNLLYGSTVTRAQKGLGPTATLQRNSHGVDVGPHFLEHPLAVHAIEGIRKSQEEDELSLVPPYLV